MGPAPQPFAEIGAEVRIVNSSSRQVGLLPKVTNVRNLAGQLCLALFAVTLVIVDDALCRR